MQLAIIARSHLQHGLGSYGILCHNLSRESALFRWRDLHTSMMRVAIPVVGVVLTCRFNHTGQAFMEEPDKGFSPPRRTAALATTIIVEVSVLFYFLWTCRGSQSH